MSKSHISRVRELYKLILRVHRSLPDNLKILGDNYAREEFKRHKKCKPQEAQTFLNEWRDYAVNMSRQAAPIRSAKRPPADRQQVGTSRKVRGAEQGQAAWGKEVKPAAQGQVAGGKEVKPAAQGQTAGGKEVKAAAQEQAARGKEVKPADQRQAAIKDVVAAAGTNPRFGNDLNEEHIEQLSSEQLINLFRLLITTRGKGPKPEYANEPIDIEHIEADVFSKLTEDSNKQILKMESDEIRKLIRAEIQEQNKNLWFELLSDGQTAKDFEEYKLAANGGKQIGKGEAKKARLDASIAEKKSEKTNKIAYQAAAEDAKKTAAPTEAPQGKTLQKTVIKFDKNALKKANKSKAMHEKVSKMEAKSKEAKTD